MLAYFWQLEHLIKCVLSLDWHQRNLLQCVESILPATVRGLHFQQVLAINVAIKLIDTQDDEDEDSSGNEKVVENEEKEYKLRLDYPVKVSVRPI